MDNINEDVLCEIISHLDAVSIVFLLRTCKRNWNLIRKPIVTDRIDPYKTFIKYKQWNKGLIESVSKFNYPQIAYFISKGADELDEALHKACYLGNLDLVKYFEKLGAKEWNYYLVFLGGHQQIIDYCSQKVAPSASLAGAARAGRLDLIRTLLVDFKPNRHQLNAAMCSAVEGGHKDIVDFFISQGAIGWDEAIFSAAYSGSKEMLEFFWNKVKDEDRDANYAMCKAIVQDHKDIVNWLIEHGAYDWNRGLIQSAEYGKPHMVDFFIKKGATNFAGAMTAASRGGHLDLVKFFVEKGMSKSALSFALADASMLDQREVIEYLMKQKPGDLNEALRFAARHGHVSLVEYLVANGATDLNGALEKAAERGRMKAAEWLVKKGARDLENAAMVAQVSGKQQVADFLRSKVTSNKK